MKKTVQIKRKLEKISIQTVRCSLTGDQLFPVAEACTGTCVFLRQPKKKQSLFYTKIMPQLYFLGETAKSDVINSFQ